MIYDNPCDRTWEANKSDGLTIAKQYRHKMLNEFSQNSYLCCLKENGEEMFKAFRPKKRVAPLKAFSASLHVERNQEYDDMYKALKEEGVKAVIIVNDLHAIINPERVSDVRAIIVKWSRAACLKYGIHMADIITVARDEVISQKQHDEQIRKWDKKWIGSLDTFYKEEELALVN